MVGQLFLVGLVKVLEQQTKKSQVLSVSSPVVGAGRERKRGQSTQPSSRPSLLYNVRLQKQETGKKCELTAVILKTAPSSSVELASG